MALRMSQAYGLLSGLGDLRDQLYGSLIAAKQSGLPEPSYQNLKRASDLLVTSEDYLPSEPDAARGRLYTAQRLFAAEEAICVKSNPAYCTKFGVERFAEIFRENAARVQRSIDNADRQQLPAPPAPAPHWNWANLALLGFALLGGYVVLRGLSRGARAIGAGAVAGTRAAREVIKA